MTDPKLSGDGKFDPGDKDWTKNRYGRKEGYSSLEDAEDTPALLGAGFLMIAVPIAAIAALLVAAYVWRDLLLSLLR